MTSRCTTQPIVKFNLHWILTTSTLVYYGITAPFIVFPFQILSCRILICTLYFVCNNSYSFAFQQVRVFSYLNNHQPELCAKNESKVNISHLCLVYVIWGTNVENRWMHQNSALNWIYLNTNGLHSKPGNVWYQPTPSLILANIGPVLVLVMFAKDRSCTSAENRQPVNDC